MIRTGPAHLRFQQAAVVKDVLLERRAFRAKRPATDGMVRIALNMHDLRCDILRFVAECVNDDTATHRAIRTRASRLGSLRNSQGLSLRIDGLQREAEGRYTCTSDESRLDECSS